MRKRVTLIIMAAAFAVLLTACGSDDSGDSAAGGGNAPATTEAAGLNSCTVISPDEVNEALGVTGATTSDGPPDGDCLWDADQETSILNVNLDPPVELINLSVLIDETTITVPGGDQAVYEVDGQCLQGVKNDQRMRICVFGDGGGDPQAAAEALWAAAVERL